MSQEKAAILTLIDEGIIPRLQQILGSGDIPEIARRYGKRWKLQEYTGKKIDIFPTSYSQGEVADRRTDFFFNGVTFVVHERYTAADDVPDEWMDEQLLFVETKIFDPLTSVRDPYSVNVEINGQPVTFYVQTAEVTTAYDFRMYFDNKVFWSEIEATFSILK